MAVGLGPVFLFSGNQVRISQRPREDQSGELKLRLDDSKQPSVHRNYASRSIEASLQKDLGSTPLVILDNPQHGEEIKGLLDYLGKFIEKGKFAFLVRTSKEAYSVRYSGEYVVEPIEFTTGGRLNKGIKRLLLDRKNSCDGSAVASINTENDIGELFQAIDNLIKGNQPQLPSGPSSRFLIQKY